MGLAVPDEGATVGQPWLLRVTGRTTPAGVTCRITNTEPGPPIPRPRLGAREGQPAATVTLPTPGLYDVSVSDRSAAAPITQLVLACEPDDDA